MKRFIWKAAVAIPATTLLLTGSALTVPAQAAPLAITGCGAVLSSSGSYTLANDIGPCTGDGIDIVASGVTLRLNGHTITGNDTNNNSGAQNSEQIGVNLLGVSGVSVSGPGTVTHFDAGVSITGGGGNTIKNLAANANIAHVLLTGGGATTVGQLRAVPCNFGDGITTDFSSSNTISGNTANGNGPYSGISLVDTSVKTNIAGNTVSNNNVSNILTGGAANLIGHSGPCGPFGSNTIGFGRTHQDIGIRIEGPGASNNIVQRNVSTDNQLEGIALHGHVCDSSPAHGGPPPTPTNDFNLVEYNTVLRNGAADVTDGISILEQGPTFIVCPSANESIIGNVSSNNANDGIFVAGRGTHDNKIIGNTVLNNGNDGVELTGPSRDRNGNIIGPGAINNVIAANTGHGNSNFDGEDLNPGCDNNMWAGNHFVTVSQACIH